VIKLFEWYWVAWYIFFSEPIHIFFKLIGEILKKTFKDDLHAIYDAIKWNLINIDETLNARKEWLKLKEGR
jgi:hypothetical protein